jgi:hypothetical protein
MTDEISEYDSPYWIESAVLSGGIWWNEMVAFPYWGA